MNGRIKSGPVSPAQHLAVVLTTTYTTSLVLPQVVPLDTVTSSSGMSLASGQLGVLKAGRTYSLQATVRAIGGAHVCTHQWFDATSGAYIGIPARSVPAGASTSDSEAPTLLHVFTPSVDTLLELHITSSSSLTVDIDGRSYTAAVVAEIRNDPPCRYAVANLAADITAALSIPHQVPFDAVLEASGIALTAGQFSGLEAGKTYHLQAQLTGIGSSGNWTYQWFDVTSGVYIGGEGFSIAVNTSATPGTGGSPPATAVFTPAVDTTVELHVTAAASSAHDIRGVYTGAAIFELGGAEQRRYVEAGLSTGFSVGATPAIVPLDIDRVSHGLSLDTSVNIGRFGGLRAGRTYLLEGKVGGSGNFGFWVGQWFNVTTGAYVGSESVSIAQNSGTGYASCPLAWHVFTPEEDTELEFHLVQADAVFPGAVTANYTQANVTEIGSIAPTERMGELRIRL